MGGNTKVCSTSASPLDGEGDKRGELYRGRITELVMSGSVQIRSLARLYRRILENNDGMEDGGE